MYGGSNHRRWQAKAKKTLIGRRVPKDSCLVFPLTLTTNLGRLVIGR